MGIRSNFARYLLVVIVGATTLGTLAWAQDVRTYCSKIGDDDRVQPVPDALIPIARRIFDVSAETSDSDVQASTSVRCMNGIVWICSYGANLICEKADVSRDSPGAEKFCSQNPGSAGVPMSATGHATVYDWTCVGRKAHIARRVLSVDARGFIADNWKPLQ